MKIDINISLDNNDLCLLIDRYHFRNCDFEHLRDLYGALIPLIEPGAYYCINHCNEQIDFDEYAACIVTLGDGIDKLQELYSDRELLEEAYMIECIGMELLSKAYKVLIKELESITGKYVSRLEFLGDTYSLELLPNLFEQINPENISYNSYLQIIPSKSVSLLLPLSMEGTTNELCSVCLTCKNKTCAMRKAKENSKQL